MEKENTSKKLLTTKEAAEFFDCYPNTLTIMRMRGEGPQYHKLGDRLVRYRPSDLVDYLEKTRIPTCDQDRPIDETV